MVLAVTHFGVTTGPAAVDFPTVLVVAARLRLVGVEQGARLGEVVIIGGKTPAGDVFHGQPVVDVVFVAYLHRPCTGDDRRPIGRVAVVFGKGKGGDHAREVALAAALSLVIRSTSTVMLVLSEVLAEMF